MSIHILKPGMQTTVQDLGRYGFAHLGISPAGAADALSLRIANQLLGNDENAAALEMTMIGATLQFDRDALIALTGAECGNVRMNCAIEIAAGTVLDCQTLRNGARTYLAFQGGLRVPRIMESASTFLPGRFGGFRGRALMKGDLLEIADTRAITPRTLREEALNIFRSDGPIRVTQGLQWGWFVAHSAAEYLALPWQVSPHSNRAGLRLTATAPPNGLRSSASICEIRGQTLPTKPAQLLTEGVTLGAIQVPPDGQPIILFVDQQTTGGYPKLANVISADIHRLGQLRPGDAIRFELVTMEDALELLREQEKNLLEAFA